MSEINTKYFSTRKAWREWLAKNYDKEKEVWFVFPKKSSQKDRISYNDAVEEALCFGWIDSTAKTLDEEHYIQRFSKRRPKSSYSQSNIERLKWLAENNMIHPSLTGEVKQIINRPFIFPPDILKAIKKDSAAWENYQNFTESYKRIRIAYIEGARGRTEEFKKRLSNFIAKTREKKLITGHGGIDKYY